MVNKVTLIGNVGNEVEKKEFPNGKRACRFSICTNERWKDTNGEVQEKATWHRIIGWGNIAKNIVKALKKGDLVHVEGKITSSTYEKDGQTHTSVEIQCLQFNRLTKREQSEGDGW